MNGLLIAGVVMLVLLGVIRIARNYFRNEAKRMVKEFAERFPDRCMICSNHDYGVRHGHVSYDTPLVAACL